MAAEQPICIALGPSGIHLSAPYSNHHLGHNIIIPPADNNISILLLLVTIISANGKHLTFTSLEVLQNNMLRFIITMPQILILGQANRFLI